MPVKPHELLGLAKQLLQTRADEVTIRCAATRAYYAALHEVNEVFEQQEAAVRVDGESSHAEIIGRAKAYGNGLHPGRECARMIAQTLPRMRRMRNRADYDLTIAFLDGECQDMVERAAYVLQLCEEVQNKRKAA